VDKSEDSLGLSEGAVRKVSIEIDCEEEKVVFVIGNKDSSKRSSLVLNEIAGLKVKIANTNVAGQDKNLVLFD